MSLKVAILAGDGIGPEVMPSAVRVLQIVAQQFDFELELVPGLIGGAAYDVYGDHFPPETRALCESCGAILFGSVGGPVDKQHEPKWKGCEARSLLGLRQAFGLHANYRPVRVLPQLAHLSPLRPERIGDGIDLVIVRELVGDIYFGPKRSEREPSGRWAEDVASYTEAQIARVAHDAFRLAARRRGKVTSVDKANVLATSRLWREVVHEVARDWPEIELEDMLVDNCALQLVCCPSQFDVILTGNLMGDILSDLAAALPGSLGLLPSASLSVQGFGLYEPAGGSAPTLAGTGRANPIAQILSAALLLRHSCGLEAAAASIEAAVATALARGAHTADLVGPGQEFLTTEEMTEAIARALSFS